MERQEEQSIDVLKAEYIERQLKEAGIDLPIQVEEQVVSTNTLLRQYAAQGEQRDMLLIAKEQSGGRGRKGRSFYSPEGTGLYMSLLLHPRIPPAETAMLTTLTAAATAKALENVSGREVQIKWVNDIWISGKKAVGILAESAGTITDGFFDYVIVGVGINVYEPKGGFPEEIKEVAGSVFVGQEPKENRRNQIAIEFVKQFMAFYKKLPERSYLQEYRKRSFLIGKEVRIIPTEHITGGVEQLISDRPEDRLYAKVLDVDDDCYLVVQYEDGTVEALSNGEVSIRPSHRI